jgi:hypothetical protein
MNKTKKLPFGSPKVTPTNEKMTKWNDGISQQKTINANTINVQNVPLSLVKLDPNNSRTSHLELTELINGPKLKSIDFDEDEQKLFQEAVENYFENDPKKELKINEYISLAHLAASIGNSNNLINPITVYLKDMDFYLIAGHRRTLAHYILGAESISAVILGDNPNQFEHSLIQWKENKDREDLLLSDELESIKKVIRYWENDNNTQISIRKLMGILNIRKTKSANYLAVIKAMDENELFKNAIHQKVLTSLELAYNIALMHDKSAKEEILTDLLSGNSYSYKQLMTRIKNPELSVRSPDTLINKQTNNTKDDRPYGLTIRRDVDTKTITKIMKLIIKSPELKGYIGEFETINLESKPGILAAWKKIYELLSE